MKQKIKLRQTITIHRDDTVSFFDIMAQQWERMPAMRVNGNTLATLTQQDRNRILACANWHIAFKKQPDSTTCPSSCPLNKGGASYADSGPLSLLWKKYAESFFKS